MTFAEEQETSVQTKHFVYDSDAECDVSVRNGSVLSVFGSLDGVDGVFVLEEYPRSADVTAEAPVDSDVPPAKPADQEPETWFILFVVTPCNILLGILWIAFPIYYIEFSEYFGTTKAAAGWIGSLQNGLQQVLGMVVSSPIELYGCRIVSMFGSIIVCVGIALSALATSTVYLYISYGVITGTCVT